MDGIPNTPNGAPSDAPQPSVVCPTCGATVSAQARFCGACGANLAATGPEPAAASGPIVAPAAPETDVPPDQPAQSEPAAPVAPAAGPGKTCSWCGAVSALDATHCSACGATFPTPEGDEALERAARARIEEMQKEINNKPRGSAWWPFRSH